MTFLKRLRLLTALLGVAGATAASAPHLFGDVRGGPGKPATAPKSDPTAIR